MKYHSGYAKSMYYMVEKQVCHRKYNELPLTYEYQDKLYPFGQLVHKSKDAIEGPTKRQVSSEVHGPCKKTTQLVYQLATTSQQGQR